MKIEFSDVCSSGDVSINELLDDLNLVYMMIGKILLAFIVSFFLFLFSL